MPKLTELQTSFSGGVKRDFARYNLPRGAVWWSTDMLPQLGYQGLAAALRERGGYSYFSADLSSTVATTQYLIGGVAPHSWAGVQAVIDEDGRAIKLAANGDVTDVAAANVVYQNPVFYRDLVIVPGATPKKITNAAGTLSVANLGGSPPASTYCATFNDYALLARGTSANKNRMWFAAAGDPESWDTTNQYWDFGNDLTGLATFKTAILAFQDSYVSRLRGTTPPTSAGGTGDFFADDPMWSVGCSDARSIAYWGDKVLFASAEGIFITDGATVDDVTVKTGMLSWWQETMGSYDSSTWTIVGGILRDHYFINVMDGATAKVGAMIDLRRLAWWPTTNIEARSMWSSQTGAGELYFGNRDTDRASKLSTVFMPSSTVKNDGDGTAVAGTWETPFYRGALNTKNWNRLKLTHYLRDYATDNPTVTVGYVTTPEDTTYTSFSTTLSENTTEGAAWINNLGFGSSGAAFKFTRANAGDWQVAGLEADVQGRDGAR